MYKTIRLLVLTLAMSLCVAESAYCDTPKPSSHSSSFGSFSSNKSQATPKSNTGFGSFGSSSTTGTSGTGSSAKSTSTLSKDLDQNQAQKNALDTYDARHAQPVAAAPGAVPGGVPVPIYQAPPVQTVYRDNSMGGWFWFWLGSMFGHHNDSTVIVNNNNPYPQNVPANTASSVTPYSSASGAVTDPGTNNWENNNQAVAQHKSGTSRLLIAVWVIIGAALVGLLISYLMRSKASAKPRNYSL